MATTKRTAAQQKAINEMRAAKAAKAAKAAAEAETVQASSSSTVGHELNSEEQGVLEMMRSFTGLGLPSWKRTLIATVAALGATVGVSYIGSMVVSIIMAGAIASSYYFLALVLAVLAVIVAAYLAIKLGAKAFGYIASSSIDEDYTAVKNKITGWFAPRKVVA